MTVKTDRHGSTICPKCDRRYEMDFIGTGKLRETLRSEKANTSTPHCSYCQSPS